MMKNLLNNDQLSLIAHHYKNVNNICIKEYKNEIEIFKNIQYFIFKKLKLKIEINNEITAYSFLKYYYNYNNILLISDQNCNHLFFSKDDNILFRSIHDYLHYKHNLQFNTESALNHELKLYKIQESLYLKYLYVYLLENELYLNIDLNKFRNLIFNELAAQISYYFTFNKFMEIQKVVNFENLLNFDTLEFYK